MKSFTGKFSSARGWALLLALFLGAGMFVAACGDEEAPTPTTPTPAPAPAPAPAPPPEPEPTGPAVPANLRVSDSTSNSITWSWDAVEDVIGYQGQFSPDATFTDTDQTFLVVAPMTSHTISNLPSNTTGHFRVRSGAGTSLTDLTYSDWAEAVSGSTGDPPPAVAISAPTGISTGDAQKDSITVTWDEVDDADTYEVQQRAADGEWTAASCGDSGSNVVSTERCVATGLTAGTGYNFRVRAVPATDATDKTTSAWASTASSLSTTGSAPSDPSSGGMGDLNVRWQTSGTNNTHILFIWDQGEDSTTYETALLETYSHADDPCPTTGYGDKFSATSQEVELTAPGSVRGLCVRKKGSSDASFAWGINPPEEPNVVVSYQTPVTPVVDSKNKTTELVWDGLYFKTDFDYEIRLASDPLLPARDNKFGSGTKPTDSAVQSACDAGMVVNDYTPDANRGPLSETVDRGLTPNTGYLLCVRASNSAGTTTWAVSAVDDDSDTAYSSGDVRETFTRPAAPPNPKMTGATSTPATSAANEKLAPAWEIRTRDAHEVPRNVVDYNLSVLYASAASAKSLTAAACSTDTPPADYGIITRSNLDPKDLVDVFTATVSADDAVERDNYARRVYLCAQAKNGTTNGQGVGSWTISSAYTVSKPAGLSASVSFTKTKNTGDPVTYDVDAEITIKNWNKPWSYILDDHDGNADSCTPDQTGATQTLDWDGLALSAKRTLQIFASRDCAEGTRLTTQAYTNPSS